MFNLIVEGLDRTGKSSLIDGMKNTFGFTTVLHYQKPQKLSYYGEQHPLYSYQRASFRTMFTLLSAGAGIICDRAHLGEAVYAPLYRGYSGEYVFDLEEQPGAADALQNTLLVLLTASDTSFLIDDGQSHDYSKRNEEQELFVEAYERSAFKYKMLVDVSASSGYRYKSDILWEVTKKFISVSPSL